MWPRSLLEGIVLRVGDWVVKRDGTDVRDGVILLIAIANNTALIEWLGPEPRASWEVMDTLTDS